MNVVPGSEAGCELVIDHGERTIDGDEAKYENTEEAFGYGVCLRAADVGRPGCPTWAEVEAAKRRLSRYRDHVRDRELRRVLTYYLGRFPERRSGQPARPQQEAARPREASGRRRRSASRAGPARSASRGDPGDPDPEPVATACREAA